MVFHLVGVVCVIFCVAGQFHVVATDAFGFSDHLLQILSRGSRQREPSKGHGRTLFITQCDDTEYMETFCLPMLLSFRLVYCGHPADLITSRHKLCDLDHLFVIVSRNGNPALLRAMQHPSTRNLFGDVSVVSMDRNTQKYVIDEEDKFAKLDSHAEFAAEAARVVQHHGASLVGNHAGFEYVVICDSDILFVDTLDEYLTEFDLQTGRPWDASFTFYDEHFVPPWARHVDDVRLSRNGNLTRIQGGMILFNLKRMGAAKVSSFLRTLSASNQRTLEVLGGARKTIVPNHQHAYHDFSSIMQNERCDACSSSAHDVDKHRAKIRVEQTQLLVECKYEFRGPFQGALAHLLAGHSRRNLYAYLGAQTCALCGGIARVGVNGPGYDDQHVSFDLDIRGIPARYLNQAESLKRGYLYDGLVVYHLKGNWWRGCLGASWPACLPGVRDDLLDSHGQHYVFDDRFARFEWRSDPYFYWVFIYEFFIKSFCQEFDGACVQLSESDGIFHDLRQVFLAFAMQ